MHSLAELGQSLIGAFRLERRKPRLQMQFPHSFSLHLDWQRHDRKNVEGKDDKEKKQSRNRKRNEIDEGKLHDLIGTGIYKKKKV